MMIDGHIFSYSAKGIRSMKASLTFDDPCLYRIASVAENVLFLSGMVIVQCDLNTSYQSVTHKHATNIIDISTKVVKSYFITGNILYYQTPCHACQLAFQYKLYTFINKYYIILLIENIILHIIIIILYYTS